MNKLKSLSIFCLSLLAVGTLISAAACDNQQKNPSYKVVYLSGADDASGSAPAPQSYHEGETVILAAANTFSRDGYDFSAWSDGSQSFNAASAYTMPAHDVSFTAVWTENVQLPEGTLVATPPNTNLVTRNGNASATWSAEYAADSLNLVAWVRDDRIYTSGSIFQNDGVSVYLNRVEHRRGFSDETTLVRVDAAGNSRVTAANTGSLKATSKISSSVTLFSIEGKKVDGYRVSLSVPYAEIGFSAQKKDAAIAVVLTNASNAGNANEVYDTAFGVKFENVHTYAHISDNDTFVENPELLYGAVFGDGGEFLTGASSWNIDHDSRDGQGYITLDEDDDRDNYLYMHSSNHKEVYVEMKFMATHAMKTVTEEGVTSYDPYPKFGITLTAADGATRLFYYVNACSNATMAGGRHLGVINQGATDLEYVTKNGEVWGFGNEKKIGKVGETSAVYQLDRDEEHYVTLGVYRNGSLVKFYCNGAYIATVTTDLPDDAYFGVASIKMGLKVTGYSVKTSNLDSYRNAENLDYLILGDSYLDYNFFSHYMGMFEGTKAVNLAVGGTQTDYWKDLLSEISTRYQPKNILLHIGTNDINSGAASDVTTRDNVLYLLNELKKLYPQAKIAYIGIADTPSFHANEAKYEVVNNAVKALDGITYVDLPAALTESNGKPNDLWFQDGLHLSTNGYGILEKLVCEAFGIDYETDQSGFGTLAMSGADVGYTGGWHYDEEDETWRNRGYGDNQLFIKGAYGATVYAEAKISIRALLKEEDSGKSGLYIQSDKIGYFFFINNSAWTNTNGEWNDHYAAVAYRYLETGKNEWVWPETVRPEGLYTPFASKNGGNAGENGYAYTGTGNFDYNTGKDHFVTLALAKIGKEVYFFCDSIFIGATSVTTEFGEDEPVAVSVYNFNMDMYAKEGFATTDPEEVLRHRKPAGSDKLVDGLMDDWTEDEMNNPKEMFYSGGVSAKVYASLGEYGLSVVYELTLDRLIVGKDMYFSTCAEFYVGGDEKTTRGTHCVVSYSGGTLNVTSGAFYTEDRGDMKFIRLEAFVRYASIDQGQYNEQSEYIPASFFWRNESVIYRNIFGQSTYYHYMGVDRFNGTSDKDAPLDCNGNQFRITHKGFLSGNDVKVDGKADDTAWSEVGNGNIKRDYILTARKGANDSKLLCINKSSMKAFLGTDGVYLMFKFISYDGDIDLGRKEMPGGNDSWWKYSGLQWNWTQTDGTSRNPWGRTDAIAKTDGGSNNVNHGITNLVFYDNHIVYSGVFYDQAAYTWEPTEIEGHPDAKILTIEAFIGYDRTAFDGVTEQTSALLTFGGQIFSTKATDKAKQEWWYWDGGVAYTMNQYLPKN